MSLAMAGSGAVYTLVTADLLARMPAHITSFASGILAGAQSMALIIVSPLAGLLVDRLGSYDVPCIALGLWAIPGGIIWLATRPAVRYIPPPASTAAADRRRGQAAGVTPGGAVSSRISNAARDEWSTVVAPARRRVSSQRAILELRQILVPPGGLS
jgi:MFS family permease